MAKQFGSMLICLFAVVGCVDATPSGPGFNLVSGGKSDYHIVLPANASPLEAKAADVFQRYIRQISGATLPIDKEGNGSSIHLVFIGRTRQAVSRFRFDGLAKDAYVISTKDGNLYLGGNGDKGALYAVYAFLEKYIGCRKYDSGPAMVPTRQTIPVKGDFVDKVTPSFEYREAFFPESADTEYLDWHHLNRIYTLWVHPFANQIVSALKYFNAHPEYFALVDGKRYGKQLDLSNDTVLQMATEEVKQMINDHPDQAYWALSPNDDIHSCQCPRCTAKNKAEGYIQGSVMPFVNSIANQFPDHQFITYAYQYAARPPHTLMPAPNLTIFLSSIDATRESPLSESASAANFRTNLTGWMAKTQKLFVWDYSAQFTNYLKPFPDLMNMQPNLDWLHDKGVAGVFIQGTGVTEGDCSVLKSYMAAELLWNTSLSTDDLITDFCQGYYGKAGTYIKTYLYNIDKNRRSTGASLNIYGDSTSNFNTYLAPNLVAQYDALLQQAEAAVQDDPVLLKRVKAFRLPVDYVILEQARMGMGSRVGNERISRFAEDCRASGVKTLKEGNYTPDQYMGKVNGALQRRN